MMSTRSHPRARVTWSTKNATVEDFPDALRNTVIIELERRISEVQASLVALKSRYDSEWPAVKQAESELSELESQMVAAKNAGDEMALKIKRGDDELEKKVKLAEIGRRNETP